MKPETVDKKPYLKTSESLFRKLLYLYPRHYRENFGEEMAANFVEITAEVYGSKGAGGLFLEWLYTIQEVFGHAVIERVGTLHIEENKILALVFGYAAITAGLTSSMLTAVDPSHDGFSSLLTLLLFVSSTLALGGIYIFQNNFVTPKAVYGFLIMGLGLMFQFLEAPSGITSSFHLTGMLMIVGTSLNAKKFTSSPALLWLASPFIGLPGLFIGGINDLGFILGAAVFGLGYIFFGFDILNDIYKKGENK